jgi:aromatic ring-opening dioxygenase LigB subunit
MSLVGCYVTPHPPVVVPAVGGSQVEKVRPTLEALQSLAGEAARLAPETIVLISPHAGLDRSHMGVGVSGRYRGDLGLFGAPQAAADLEGDTGLAESVLRDSLAREVPVLPRGRQDGVQTLDHGALVPLYFLLSQLPELPRLVLLTFSLLGTPEHVQFGHAVGTAIEVSGRRTLFVASGDLSHRLLPGAPAGYNPRGKEFDERVAQAFSQGDAETLTHLPPSLVEAAGECGYRSLLVLIGLLGERAFRTRLLSYEGPFGVGYLVGAVDLDEGSAAPGNGGGQAGSPGAGT